MGLLSPGLHVLSQGYGLRGLEGLWRVYSIGLRHSLPAFFLWVQLWSCWPSSPEGLRFLTLRLAPGLHSSAALLWKLLLACPSSTSGWSQVPTMNNLMFWDSDILIGSSCLESVFWIFWLHESLLASSLSNFQFPSDSGVWPGPHCDHLGFLAPSLIQGKCKLLCFFYSWLLNFHDFIHLLSLALSL